MSCVKNAFHNYGSLELLPDSFWAAMEREEVGWVLDNVLEKLGDAETLKWLEEFKQRCPWQEQRSLDSLDETIGNLRKKLAEEEKGKSHTGARLEPQPAQSPAPSPPRVIHDEVVRSAPLPEQLKTERASAKESGPESAKAERKKSSVDGNESSALWIVAGVLAACGIAFGAFLLLRHPRKK